MVDQESLQAGYLRLADDADQKRRTVTDPLARESWERIIVGYLELAEMAKPQG